MHTVLYHWGCDPGATRPRNREVTGAQPTGAESRPARAVPRSSRLASKVTLTHALNGFVIALGELRPWKTL